MTETSAGPPDVRPVPIPPASQGSSVLAFAFAGGVVGTILGVPTLELLDPSLPGPPGFLTVAQLALGGGFGWYGGAVIGWTLRRGAPPSSPDEARGLAIASACIIAFGTIVAWWSPSMADWVSVGEDLDGTPFEHMRNVIMLDTYLAAGTCLAFVPSSSRGRRFALVLGAAAGILLLVAAVLQFLEVRA